jgi:MFS family permease
MDNLGLMTIVSFVVFMAGGITGPVNSLYVESLGASYVAIGLLGTSTSLTMIVFSYVWGRFSDRLGRRKGLLASGLIVMALSHGLAALAGRYELLFPIRILGAVATAAYSTSNLALVGDMLERHADTRGQRVGTLRGLSSLGFGLMAFVSGSIADAFSIRVPFLLAAGFLVVAVLVLTLVRENPRECESDALEGSRADSTLGATALWQRGMASVRKLITSIRQPTGTATASQAESGTLLPLAPLLLSALLWSLATGAVYAVWANYMVRELGYSSGAMSRLWALASTSEFPLMIAAGWLSDRLGRLPMLGVGFVAWMLVFVGYIVVPTMPWIVLVQLTRGFAYSAYTASAMTYATEVRSQAQRGRVSGLYSSAGGIGTILGTSAGGAQTQLFGFRAMIGTNALLMFVAAVYVWVVYFRHLVSQREQSG